MKKTVIINKNNEIHPETFELLLPSYVLKEEASKGNKLQKEQINIISFISKEENNDRVYNIEWKMR